MAFVSDSGVITGVTRNAGIGGWRLDVLSPLERDGVISAPAHNYSLSIFVDLCPAWTEILPHAKGLELVFHGHLGGEGRTEVAVLGMGLTPRSVLALRKRLAG
ncbi:hypothetical protein [Paeniglutamicibacter kerguelensis]|uniref:Uncharacterized protein n=1 Tax=Paeniglutamicibacter kerguelensis TaxID=254788 RepID=A0ABS4XAD2_9MICC|nr:hypothetical protein [Paeniglutamicibacter kerguelensis]MBP2385417.1 hypothetical protein [Paeniglutamicibacter kerguelensis]